MGQTELPGFFSPNLRYLSDGQYRLTLKDDYSSSSTTDILAGFSTPTHWVTAFRREIEFPAGIWRRAGEIHHGRSERCPLPAPILKAPDSSHRGMQSI